MRSGKFELGASANGLAWLHCSLGGSRVMQSQSENEESAGVIRWRPHRPIFGWLSIGMVFGAAVVAVLSVLIPMYGSHGEDGLAFIAVGWGLGGVMCIASVVISLIDLARRETPRWPAIVGLTLSALPALGGVYLLCGAPW